MSPTRHEDLEETIRRCFDAGDLHGAATAALEGYGPEILGMLYGTVRDEEAVAEIFSSFTEDLWGGLGSFRWGCTFRTWAFRLAHNARHRHFRSHRPPAVPLSQAPAVAELAEQVRSRTHAHLRTSVKDRMAAIRARLEPEEQLLLILRIDKKMAWNDIAVILLGEPEPTPAQIARRANALRQQLHKLKERLRQMAREEGLLSEP